MEDHPIADLRFDPENARLPVALLGGDQDSLLRYLAGTRNLQAIGESMATVGYFEEEPLLITPNDPEPNTFIVVEGNRRLAALKLLTETTARGVVGGRIWESLAERANEFGFAFQHVPTMRYATKDELLDYLGFRHVSGIAPWSPDAKARFIARLIVQHGRSFYEAGRAIGSRSDAVRRQFVAYQALQVAKELGIDPTPAQQDFGVWFRALQNPSIRGYISLHGWLDDEAPADLQRPVPEDRADSLREVLSWLFGETSPDDGETEPVKPVIHDSREIDDLGRVLRHSSSVAMLRATSDLRGASEMVGTERDIIATALTAAHRSLIIAAGQADLFIGDAETVQLAERVQSRLDTILRILKPAPTIVDGTTPRP